MEEQSPAPKSQRAKHQQSRSAANASPLKLNNGAAMQPGVKGHNKASHSKQHKAQASHKASLANREDGYFDTNGRFVVGHQQESPQAHQSPAIRRHKQDGTRGNKDKTGGELSQTSNQQFPVGQHDGKNVTMPTATPVKQAYAGPTFHASPAASALPMPKFLSKSVPAGINSTESTMQTRMEQEAIEPEESIASDSPLQGNSKPITSLPIREESPLDFFFKADKEEKARTASQGRPVTPRERIPVPVAQSAPPQALSNNWSSIYGDPERHHSRHASSGSNPGVFALELDGASGQTTQRKSFMGQEPSTRAPPDAHRAQTESLRNYLNATVNTSSPSPRPNIGPNRLPSGYSSDQQGGQPVYRNGQQTRGNPGPNTPPPQGTTGLGNRPLHYGNRNLSPMFQATKNDSLGRSSALRHEMPASLSPYGPTESVSDRLSPHGGNAGMVHTNSPIAQAPRDNHGARTHPPPTYQRSKSTGTGSPSANIQTMENDLRRILKLGPGAEHGSPGWQ